MRKSPKKHLESLPEFIHFGHTFQHALLTGVFQICGAKKLYRTRCSSDDCDPHFNSPSLPDWLTLDGPTKWDTGLAWRFDLATRSPGPKHARIHFECDTGTGSIMFQAQVERATAPQGDVIVCEEAVDACRTWESIAPLIRVLGGLNVRTHHYWALPDIDTSWPRTILLHGGGLLNAAKTRVEMLHRLAEGGTNILILADRFFHGTPEAANAIIGRYGMKMRGGRERGAKSSAALWRQNIQICGPDQVRRHPLTRGIRNTYWHRGWPAVCTNDSATPLIVRPTNPEHCLVATAKPGGYVTVVGKSLFSQLAGIGWPYDNDKLLANLIIGGDANRVKR